MTRRISNLGTAWLLGFALATAGCSREPGPVPAGTPTLTPTSSYQFAGRGAFSRVERWVDADGLSQLRSDTVISADPKAANAPVTRLVETASLDPRGRLVRADVCRTAGGETEVCFRLDAVAGTVRVERAHKSPVEWSVPTDAPWIYQGSSGEQGELVSTPLSAWIVVRAAATSANLRVIEPARQQTHLVPVDQLAVPTEKGTTVVLAGDGIDVGEAFVEEVRLLDRGTTLTLIPVAPDPGT